MTDQDERRKRFEEERGKVGDGWHRIIDDIDESLTALLGDYDLLQIKEQYGGLRYYVILDHRYANLNIM